jgi:hypothetical protein
MSSRGALTCFKPASAILKDAGNAAAFSVSWRLGGLAALCLVRRPAESRREDDLALYPPSVGAGIEFTHHPLARGGPLRGP